MANPTIKEIEEYFQDLYHKYTSETIRISNLSIKKLEEIELEISKNFGLVQWNPETESENSSKKNELHQQLIDIILDKKRSNNIL